MFFGSRSLAVSVAAMLLSGCAGPSQSSPPTSQTLPQSKVRQFNGSVPPASTPVVYLATGGSTDTIVDIYSQSGKGQKPIGSLTGFRDITSLAVDGQGNLYVADATLGTISVFSQGQTSPYETLTGAGGVSDIAVDSANNVYCADCNANPGVISIYSPGSTSPTSTLTDTNPVDGGINNVAIDSSGDVFVYSQENELDEFPFGSTKAVKVNVNLNTIGMAFDGQQNLVVSEQDKGIYLLAPPYTGKAVLKYKTKKPYFSSFAFNADDSALWVADFVGEVRGVYKSKAEQFAYPSAKVVESTEGSNGVDRAIATYPAAPL